MTVYVHNGNVYRALIRLGPRRFECIARQYKGIINLFPFYYTKWKGVTYIVPKLPDGWKVYERSSEDVDL